MHGSHSRKANIVLGVVIGVLLIVIGMLFVAWYKGWSFEWSLFVAERPSSYLQSEEVVEVPVQEQVGTTTIRTIRALPIIPVLFEYVEVVDSCGPHYEGECVNVRSGPGTDFAVLRRLRKGVVLKVGGEVEREGEVWYKIVFDEWLRYPERLEGDWYVQSDLVNILYDEGDKTVWDNGDEVSTSSKRIIVDRSEQHLYAYNGGVLFMDTPISTGLELTPTPRGTFSVYKKTPSRYMQGPLPNLIDQQVYDLPGVPWNLYFTHGGAVIHGAYWHESFGRQYSHGCVNLPPRIARFLYTWAELGTKVEVRD